MAEFDRKILVAVDGSYCSTKEINYLIDMFSGETDIAIHLLCIVSAGPIPKVGSEWVDDKDKLSLLSSTARQKYLLAEKHLNEEMNLLKRQFFSDDQIEGVVQIAKASVAVDLIHYARKGKYDALLMGRRGLGKIQEFFMGGVTKSVLEKCFDIPIWVVDGIVDSKKILVPVDGSFHVLRAVDHLSHILKNMPNVEITLFHSEALLRRKKEHPVEDFYEQWGKDWCEENLSRPDAIFHAPEQVLVDSGFVVEHIKRAKSNIGIKPDRDIYSYLKKNDFGTIVMGRRGAEESTWLLGSISESLLYTAENLAIWMVH
jgi:nucleotide-binding universal stress UspA family protein